MTVATDPRKTGISAPASLLDASAVAVILPSSGSSNATGQITHTTALGAQPTGTVKVFLPAGVVTAGSQGTGAGLYDAIYSSTTVCQLTGTGIVTANAAYTQVVTEVTLATTTVPGGAMGLNGGFVSYALFSQTNSVNNKTLAIKFDGGSARAAVRTTTAGQAFAVEVRNRNSTNSQVAFPLTDNTVGVSVLAVDSTLSKNITFTGQLAVATDNIILEARETWLLP